MRTELLAGACVVFVALSARAVGPTVTPSEGGLGQNVVLTDHGLTPVKTPKVLLLPQAGQAALKKVTLKPFAATDVRIDVTVSSGKAGVYDVQVVSKDKGVAPVTLPDPYTILVPEPASVDPPSGPVKIPVAILGTRFGTTKGKVTIGGKKAKVTRWLADRIEVVVPKKLAAGAQPVVVTNAAGASTAGVEFTVTSGGGGGSERFFRFDEGTNHFETTTQEPIFFTAMHNVSQDFLSVGAAARPAGVPSLALSVTAPQLATPMPYDVVVTPGATGALTVTYSASGSVYVASIDSDFELTVTAFAGGVMDATFGGTLTRIAGEGPLTVTIDNGAFRAAVETVGQ